MEQSLWELIVTQSRNSYLLCNPKVHYHVHNNPPLVRILSQMNPIHTFPPYFSKIHSKNIFSSTPRYCKWSLPFRFYNENSALISHLPMGSTCPVHLILGFIIPIISGEAYKLWSSLLCSLPLLPATEVKVFIMLSEILCNELGSWFY